MKRRQKKQEKQKIRCPSCDSTYVYFRIGRHDFLCRKCGEDFVLKKASRYQKVSTR